MASDNRRGNRESKKPKAATPKTNASAPSTKGGSATVASIKKK